MWTLPLLNQEKEEKYKKIILDKIKARKTKPTEDELKEFAWLLTARPDELLFVKNALCKKKKTKAENVAIKKYNAQKYFNYETIISKCPKTSYEIAKLIGVNTCVYCNRQYTFTITKGKTQICRPEFDHYFPKDKYRLFALSLYNLIPSCHICNSSCKGTKELPDNMNPYMDTDKKKELFKFTYIPNGHGYPQKVDIREVNEGYKDEVEKIIEVFKLKEIYSAHTNYELKELYTFATKYSDTYLRSMLEQIHSNFKISQEDAYRILFGTELFEDKDNNRPFSKFKRDILRELKVIH